MPSAATAPAAPSGVGLSWRVVLGIQAVILSVLVHRLYHLGAFDEWVDRPRPDVAPCGLLNTTEFAITSTRVVLPSGVVPATGRWGRRHPSPACCVQAAG